MVSHLLTSSSKSELRFSGSKMFPPSRKWLGRTGSDWLSLLARRRRLASPLKPTPMEYRLFAIRWAGTAGVVRGGWPLPGGWRPFFGRRGCGLTSCGCSDRLMVAGKAGLISRGRTVSLSNDILIIFHVETDQPITGLQREGRGQEAQPIRFTSSSQHRRAETIN